MLLQLARVASKFQQLVVNAFTLLLLAFGFLDLNYFGQWMQMDAYR
jgi:hypothetical protein